MSQPFAFIAGTTLLDIISTITDFRHPQDAIGTTTLNFGGVAYNAAVNLRYLNVPVTLMTALNNSTISQMIKNELISNDIRLHLQSEPTIPDGIYSGHFYKGEELHNVWSNVLEDVIFSPQFIEKGMKNAACVILTNCLNVNSINNIIQIANKRSIPVFLSGASLLESLKFKHIKGQVQLIFANQAEIDILQDVGDFATPQALADHFQTSLVMTKGADGVSLFRHNQKAMHFAIHAKNVVKNSLGAGDLFMSATLKYHYFDKIDLLESIQKSLEIAPKVLERDDAHIGKKRALEDNISHISFQAERDNLTGLLNRHGLERFMKNKVNEKKVFYIALLDVDHFKSFNDAYGHDVGDIVLKHVAQTVSKSIRSQDTVGRWGGEEFVCLIDGQSPKRALAVAERIRQAVENMSGEDIPQPVTVSIGLAEVFDAPDIAIKRADVALYDAKGSGRNKVIFLNQ